MKELLDRGAGRAPQAIDITQETTHTLSDEFEMIVRRLNDKNDPLTKQLDAETIEIFEPDFSDITGRD
jgi:hypothetical protein